MKIKTSELTGAALDWCVGRAVDPGKEKLLYRLIKTGRWSPSNDWTQGGPIIERERIWVCASASSSNWFSECHKTERHWGPTPLIAAMRCYVASKLGDEVDAPEELA